MKHEAIAALSNSGVNTLSGEGLAEVSTITEHEAAQVERANASGATPVVFVHGLWLLPSSWDRWVALFEEAGFVGVTPGWPDDPETVAAAREHPEVFAGKGIGEIADNEEAIIRRLDRKPVIIGHSFGGLLTMILAGRGLAADRGAAHGQRRPPQPRQLEPCGPIELRAVPLQLRERGRRGRGEGVVPRLFRPRRRRAALPGSVCELESLVRGKGQLDEPRAGSDADRLGRLGPYGSLGDRERVLQEAEAQQGRDRDRQDARPGAFAYDRRRLARGRGEGARVRQAVHNDHGESSVKQNTHKVFPLHLPLHSRHINRGSGNRRMIGCVFIQVE